jgi:signal transduction histidine kinase
MLARLSIRWRLAVITGALTFGILTMFALVIGQLTADRVREDFDNQTAAAVDELRDRLKIDIVGGRTLIRTGLQTYAASQDAVIRVLSRPSGEIIGATRGAPNFGTRFVVGRTDRVGDFRVETREAVKQVVTPAGAVQLPVWVQYARRVSAVEATVRRVRLFLVMGVLLGTLGAVGGALVLARRSLAPISRLTATARDITRTRDPDRSVPVPETDDEVAELARTLDEMLRSLTASREETEALLDRQRQFVSDASHELRTPLTAVLANLELLAEVLDGEPAEAARSALRSTQRMRRLVADLLLLARADANRRAPFTRLDLRDVVMDAVSELGPATGGHEFALDLEPASVEGARDDLHRLCLNLMENAVRFTPDGTNVEVSVHTVGDEAVLAVEDDGPGVPEELRGQLFERFVRGAGDRGGSFGLGLSIVRAVAETHGGTVSLAEPRDGVGARFVVRIPLAAAGAAARPRPPRAAPSGAA